MTQESENLKSDPNLAFTLVELLVVLAILAAVASMAVALIGDVTVRGVDGESRTPENIVTLSNMREVRNAILGSDINAPGFRQDLGRLPDRVGELILNFNAEPPYDPATMRGWQGPYLFDMGGRYGDYLETGDGFPDNSEIAGIEADPVLLDGWGKPLLLQQADTDAARLVSAGENRVLETDPTSAIDADRGDDLILFLLTSDPNL